MHKILLLLALSSFSFALSSQQESVQLTVTEVSNLVTVEGSLDFSQLLPGYEYSTNLTVRWNVPSSALKNINVDKVPLYVRIVPRAGDSWLYFEGGSKKLDFILTCDVEAGACSPDSSLSRDFTVYMQAPKDAAYPHNDGISANASLQPFEQTIKTESAGIGQQELGKEGIVSPSSGSVDGQNVRGPSGPKTGLTLLANAPLGSIFLALFAIGSIFLIVYFREYLFEKLVAPRERAPR